MLHDIGIKTLISSTNYCEEIYSAIGTTSVTGIKPLISSTNYCEASVSWELALKAQMSEFGLNVETVAEGVLILIDTLKNHGIEVKRHE